MQLQRGLLELPGVIDAGAIMATPANRDLLVANDLLPVSIAATPDDLLIVAKADSESVAVRHCSRRYLACARATTDQEFRPRSLDAALKQLPEAGWVLVSVPGRYAAGVARDALDLGRHVFLYSDNVSLADEVALKQTARSKGLLVMGPDCGTAIINGIGLGFANRVRRGSIGVVGASGTGLQAITSWIHELGAGVSHAIGTGGRDLKPEVGGISAHQALDILARDPDTRVIVIVSKPPAPDVAARLLTAAQAIGKPVVVDFIGYAPPGRHLGNVHFATTLSEAAELAVRMRIEIRDRPNLHPNLERFAVSGFQSLFAWFVLGRHFGIEAMLMLQLCLSLYSNAPITNDQLLSDPSVKRTHHRRSGRRRITVGRLHPMLDNDLRIRRLRQEAADPEAGIIMLDVVLGEGAHPDPASELAPVIRDVIDHSGMRDRRLRSVPVGLEIVAIVIGTEDDPQNLQSQIDRLMEAGAVIFRATSEAVEYVARRLSRFAPDDYPPVALERFTSSPLAAINVGLESFYASLKSQGANVVQVDWRPPAGGNEKLAALLAKMKK
jgi:FdrA protein